MTPREMPPLRLRTGFAWTVAGNVVYGASQWAMLSLIAKLGNGEMLGQYALALARVAVLVAYDRPRGMAGERVGVVDPPGRVAILRSALPLGVVLMLVSLTINVPRYAIERYLGTRELGAFAAVGSFIAVGSAVVGALGQSAMPRLAICFSAGDLGRFRELALKLSALSLALGVAGVIAAAVAGRLVLGLAYRPEYAAYNGLLVAVMAAGVPRYVAIMLGYVLTSARSFGPQMPLLVAATMAAALASWRLVPAMGLSGAAVAIALAACVQIAGAMLILDRAMRRA
jgi:O-antigen/teichoic acid export membrane protein